MNQIETLYAELDDLVIKNKFLLRVIKKTKSQMNLKSNVSLENNTNMFFWLFIFKQEELLRKYLDYFLAIEFLNFNQWTWIESILALYYYMFQDNNKIQQIICDRLRRVYTINNGKPPQNRLNGELLFTEDINDAIADKDQRGEIESRLYQIQELCVLYSFGGSEQLTQSVILDEIKLNNRLICEYLKI